MIATVCVQDSRILGEMGRMQEIYANLFDLNRDLILEHTKRTTNHTQLLAALKNVSPPSSASFSCSAWCTLGGLICLRRSRPQVNQMIQKAARLRVGSHKMKLVSDARAAIKTNSIQALFRIIERGQAEQ